jgi:hypothetical protein
MGGREGGVEWEGQGLTRPGKGEKGRGRNSLSYYLATQSTLRVDEV